MSSDQPSRPNPLPIHDANAELQKRSVHALFAITESADLLLRPETYWDYGVDATIEVIANGRYPTNFKSAVQIKSTACGEENRDGSVSKQIDVSNLNYLLNGTCPIYLFYCATRKRFWYSWALEEFRRLQSENPKWLDQGSVNIRFSAPLTESALTDIHARIVRESHLRREITDSLACHSTHEPAKFLVDVQKQKMQTGEEAFRAIVENGFTLVTNGRWQDVLPAVGLLPANQQNEPRVRLVVAYAYYAQGRFFHAAAHCAETSVRASELSRDDQEALAKIRNACDCHMGKISREEYTRRQVSAAAAPTASLQARLEATRFQLLSERDLSRRSALFQTMRSLARTVISDPGQSEAFKLQTRVHCAYVEGYEIHTAITQSVTFFQVQLKMKQSWAEPDLRPLAEAAELRAQWEAQMQQLLRETAACSIPWLHAEALRTALLVRTALLGFQRFQAKFATGDMPTRNQVDQLLEDAKQVVESFTKAGHIEGELRAKLAIADLREILDELDAAKEIARDVRGVADALELGAIVHLADEHISETTALQMLEAQLTKDRKTDDDFKRAAMSDADVEAYGELAFASSQLPRERLAMVRQEFEAMRLSSAERLYWCRHIELIQDLRHTRHPATAYARPTEWFGKCYKHRYESLLPNTDLANTIERFKAAYCAQCPDRNPKVQSPKG